jgi:hypothetical protein
MGITMWCQMKLNPAPPDPTQKMIFDWMPLIFTFMLASFSAGLVIYWAWNNTLSVLQQAFIMNKHGAKIELWDNVKETLGLGRRRRRAAAVSKAYRVGKLARRNCFGWAKLARVAIQPKAYAVAPRLCGGERVPLSRARCTKHSPASKRRRACAPSSRAEVPPA